MKKILSLSIIAVGISALFVSCDKETRSYTCTCTVNQYLTPPNNANNPVNTFVIDDANTNNALGKCQMHMQEVLNNSGQDFTCTYQ